MLQRSRISHAKSFSSAVAVTAPLMGMSLVLLGDNGASVAIALSVFFGPMLWILFYTRARGPDQGSIADARAIEMAWESERKVWAGAVVSASISGAEGDVEAWSSADRALRQMSQRADGTTDRKL